MSERNLGHTVLKVILTFKKLSMNENECIAEHSAMHLFNCKSTFGMYPLYIQDLIVCESSIIPNL